MKLIVNNGATINIQNGICRSIPNEELIGLCLHFNEDLQETAHLAVSDKSFDKIDRFKYKQYCVSDTKVNLNDYDEIIMSAFSPNFIGGVFETAGQNMINRMQDFKGDFAYYYTDPDLQKIRNYFEYSRYRIFDCKTVKYDPDVITESLLVDLSVKAHDAKIYTSYPVKEKSDIFQGQLPSRFIFVDAWRKQLLSLRPERDSLIRLDRTVYIGSNKKKRYNRLFHLGAFQKDGPVDLFGKIAQDKSPFSLSNIGHKLSSYKSHLVIQHPSQYDCGVSHRVMQALSTFSLPLIDAESDKERKLLNNKALRDICYVSSREEIERINDEVNYESLRAEIEDERLMIKSIPFEDYKERVYS